MAHPHPQPQLHPQHQDKHQDKPDAPPIPPLQIGPAIFVPITTDLTIPPPATPSRSSRLTSRLAAHDAHTAGVQSNLLAMLTREKARLVAAGAALETTHDPTPAESRPDLPEELALMLEFMRAPHDPSFNYDQKDAIPPLNLGACPPPRSQREWTARELMAWSYQAAVEMNGHREHCAQQRKRYEGELQEALKEEAK